MIDKEENKIQNLSRPLAYEAVFNSQYKCIGVIEHTGPENYNNTEEIVNYLTAATQHLTSAVVIIKVWQQWIRQE